MDTDRAIRLFQRFTEGSTFDCYTDAAALHHLEVQDDGTHRHTSHALEWKDRYTGHFLYSQVVPGRSRWKTITVRSLIRAILIARRTQNPYRDENIRCVSISDAMFAETKQAAHWTAFRIALFVGVQRMAWKHRARSMIAKARAYLGV